MNRNQRTYNFFYHLTHHRLIIWTALILSFLEASIWFILPDLLLSIYLVLRPKKLYPAVQFTFVASLLGTTVYLLFTSSYFDLAESLHHLTPFSRPDKLIELSLLSVGEFTRLGFFQSISTIPIKTWTLAAIVNHHPVYIFIPIFISRFFRLFLVGIIFSTIGSHFKDLIKRHFLVFITLYCLAFLLGLILSSQ